MAVLDAEAVGAPAQVGVEIVRLETGADARMPAEQREVGEKARLARDGGHFSALSEPANEAVGVPENGQRGLCAQEAAPGHAVNVQFRARREAVVAAEVVVGVGLRAAPDHEMRFAPSGGVAVRVVDADVDYRPRVAPGALMDEDADQSR